MRFTFLPKAACAILAAFLGPHAAAADNHAILTPYAGPRQEGVDTDTLEGKVMCGYQGWFNAEGDGANCGWRHYEKRGRFEPGRCTIDYWPDVSDLTEDETYPTPFRHEDGSVAYVFSSYNKQTVLRHFEWMKTYGIDGAFVQRFATETIHPRNFNHFTTVLSHAREGANRFGRAYALMYDLSGLQEGQTAQVKSDWKRLVDGMRLTRDPGDHAYLGHNGKPLIALWGMGFNDDRKYTLAECLDLIQFFQDDPQYGGCTVMAGVPTGWRTLERDSVKDPLLREIVKTADVISPWTVGRYRDPAGARRHARQWWAQDVAWCEEQGKDYLPVVFPGFSWHNLFPDSPLNAIPRLEGRFFWSQVAHVKRAGARMLYVAMFDEMDEGTAIFKCSNNPPVGDSPFLTYEGLPADHYLWLAGEAAKVIRGERAPAEKMPQRP